MISINYESLKNKLGKLIENKKNKKFIIYPMGVQGALVKGILNGQYGIVEDYIIDNSLCQEKKWIHPVSLLGEIPCENYLVILTCENPLYIRDEETLRQRIFPVFGQSDCGLALKNISFTDSG